MPTKPRFRCKVPTCDEPATRGGYCAQHAPTHKPSTSDHRQRDPEKYRIYHSARWKALRRLILGRQPICQRCGVAGSEVCDHIVAIEDGGAKWASSNLQGLCWRCSNQKSQEERRARASRKDTPPSSTPGSGPADDKPAPKRERRIRAI